MSKTRGVWVVREGHAIIGCWTIQHEIVAYLSQRFSLQGLTVTCFEDNNPRYLSKHYTAEEFMLKYDPDYRYRQCPFWIASNGGPRDLPGAYGPGTCMGGCWEEPACMT